MVTSKLQLEELPHASVAVQFTVVFPTGKHVPEGGVQTIFGAPPQASVVVTTNVSALHESPLLATVSSMLPGHVIVGGVVSLTVMAWLCVVTLPHTSVA